MQNVFNFVNNVFSVNSFKTCWLSTIWAKFRIYFSVTVFAVHLIRQIFYQFVVCSRFGKIATNGWYMLSGRISESVPVRRTRNCDARIRSWRTTEPRPAICTLLWAGFYCSNISRVGLLLFLLYSFS